MNYGKNKFGNKKTVVDGYNFDSKKEAARYVILRKLYDKKIIKHLELQPRFEIFPAYHRDGKKVRNIEYVADFRYTDENGIDTVEDVKGHKTDVYKIKKKMFLFRHHDFVFIDT